MADIDWTRCPHQPWDHQKIGVQKLIENPAYLLMDEVGVGKSLQVTSAACALFEAGVIDTVLVVTPAFARSVWGSSDPLLGEFAKHCWFNTPYRINEYSAKSPKLPGKVHGHIDVLVTNYEFIRRVNHRNPLVKWAASRKTLLVLDESWAVSNPRAEQTKACYLIRQACERIVELNGTPGPPEHLFSQFQILNSSILDCKGWHHFRARYCVMGGYMNKRITSYQRMDDFKARTQPYALRREAKDCLDLPPVLPPLAIEARLSPAEWQAYKKMRDELVVWLDSGDVSIARQAGVRTLRLAQILAGFLGGVEDMSDDGQGNPAAGTDSGVPRELHGGSAPRSLAPPSTVRDIGRAKLDAILAWLEAQDVQKCVVWCRFRMEMSRMAEAFRAQGRVVHLLQGQQAPDDRTAAKFAFAPSMSPRILDDESPRMVLVGHPAAGGAGINLAAANIAIYATNGFSLKDRQQSEGRLNRPGQTQPVRFVDVVAVGPDGQKTLDHAILSALRGKADVASWTAANWKQALLDE